MKTIEQKSEGMGYFNLARGVGMLMIVLGHSMNPILVKQQNISLFAGAGSILGGGIIAMFFMISGFGFYKRSFRKCLSIQSKFLIRPYVTVAGLVLLSKVILAIVKQRSFYQNGGELVLTYLLGLNAEGGGEFLGIPIESISIFWFILALFGGWMIYNQIARLKSTRIQISLVFCCVLVSYLMTLVSKVWPFCLPMAFLAAGYLAAGDYIRRNRLLEKKLPFWFWVLIGTNLIVSMAFGNVNIVACVWGLGLLDVTGSFVMGFLLLRLYAVFMRRRPEGKFISLLEQIGFYSIWIVCLHAYEKIIFPWYRIYGIFPKMPWLAVVLCFAGRCIVMYILYRILVYIIRKKKKRKKRVITLE